MSRFADRITKLETQRSGGGRSRRVVRHIVDCAPVDRPARVSSIAAVDTEAFHVIRVIVRPGERVAA